MTKQKKPSFNKLCEIISKNQGKSTAFDKPSFDKPCEIISKNHGKSTAEIWESDDWNRLPEPEVVFPSCEDIAKLTLREIAIYAELLRGQQIHIVSADVNNEENERQDKLYDVLQKAVDLTNIYLRVRPSPGGPQRAEALKLYLKKRGKPKHIGVRYLLLQKFAKSRVRIGGKFTSVRWVNPWFP